jgi:hypothetical protein
VDVTAVDPVPLETALAAVLAQLRGEDGVTEVPPRSPEAIMHIACARFIVDIRKAILKGDWSAVQGLVHEVDSMEKEEAAAAADCRVEGDKDDDGGGGGGGASTVVEAAKKELTLLREECGIRILLPKLKAALELGGANTDANADAKSDASHAVLQLPPNIGAIQIGPLGELFEETRSQLATRPSAELDAVQQTAKVILSVRRAMVAKDMATLADILTGAALATARGAWQSLGDADMPGEGELALAGLWVTYGRALDHIQEALTNGGAIGSVGNVDITGVETDALTQAASGCRGLLPRCREGSDLVRVLGAVDGLILPIRASLLRGAWGAVEPERRKSDPNRLESVMVRVKSREYLCIVYCMYAHDRHVWHALNVLHVGMYGTSDDTRFQIVVHVCIAFIPRAISPLIPPLTPFIPRVISPLTPPPHPPSPAMAFGCVRVVICDLCLLFFFHYCYLGPPE